MQMKRTNELRNEAQQVKAVLQQLENEEKLVMTNINYFKVQAPRFEREVREKCFDAKSEDPFRDTSVIIFTTMPNQDKYYFQKHATVVYQQIVRIFTSLDKFTD